MKSRILSILLVVALLVTVAVFSVQADAPLTKDAADAIIADVTNNLDTNTDFDATSNAGTVSAVCPYCGGEAKDWEPLPVLSTNASYSTDKHFYVPAQADNGEFTTAGRYLLSTEGKTICIYLNGQTINDSISDTAAFMVTKGTLNFLGSGTVKAVASPGANKAGARGVLDVGGSAAGSTINVFGGTFESTGTAPTVTIRSQYTSAVNVYDGTIGSTAQTVETVRFIGGSNKSNGTFNLFDGTVNAGTGKSAIEFSTVNSYKAHGAEVNISGGTVNSGNVTGGGIYMDVAATVNMSGGLLANSGDKHTVYISNADAEFNLSGTGIVNGGVHVDNKDCEVSVDGTSVISSDNGGLDLTSGAKLTLGNNMAAGADITVTVNDGVFTNVNTSAAAIAAAGYIKETETLKAIRADNNTLVLGSVKDAADAMSFAETTTAVCPYCGDVATWEPLPVLSTNASYSTDKHFYVPAQADNGEFTTAGRYLLSTEGKTICIYLNGQTINDSISDTAAFMVTKGTLNFLGSGTVKAVASPGANKAGARGVLDVGGSAAGSTINVFGGTFESTGTAPTVTIRSQYTSAVNVYDGTIGSTAQTVETVRFIGGSNKSGGKFNLFGGTVNAGTGKSAIEFSTVNSYIANGAEVNISGGTINSGNVTGGGINLNVAATVNMSGGTITNSIATTGNGVNVYINKEDAQFHMTGGTVSMTKNATGAQGGNFYVLHGELYVSQAEGKTTQIINGKCSHNNGGGNILAVGTALIDISGGTISGGEAIKGGNISTVSYNGNPEVKISGGSIIGGTASGGLGDALYITSATLTLDGNAQVCENVGDGIYITSSGSIAVKSDFIGTAKMSMDETIVTGRGVKINNGSSTGAYIGLLIFDNDNVDNALVIPVETATEGVYDLYVAGVDLYKNGTLAGGALDNDDAVAKFTTGSYDYIKAASGGTFTLTDASKIYVIDLAGNNITVNADVENVVFAGINSASTTEAANEATATLGAGVVNGYRAQKGDTTYVGLQAEGSDTVTVHALKMQVTAVALRTTTGGIYYWASYECDDTLAAAVESFGLVYNLGSAPSTDLAQNMVATELAKEDFVRGEEIIGGIMNNILVAGARTDSDGEPVELTNDQAADLAIYAAPYITVTGADGGAKMVMADASEDTMYLVVKAIDDMISGMDDSDAKKAQYINMMNTKFDWAGYAFEGEKWSQFENFGPAVQ